MTARKLRDLGLAFLAAWIGYRIFNAIGFPAAALTGSTAAVTIVALLGVSAELPVRLRNACILVLGVNIGTGVTPEVIQTAIDWPLSLTVMTACVLAIMFVSSRILEHLFGFDRTTAFRPPRGHLTYVLSIAAETGKDVPAIAILQSVRVLILTLCVPPLVAFAFGAVGVSLLPDRVMTPAHLGMIIAATIPVALMFSKLRFPASWLLAGMAVSAIAHGTGLAPGRLPDPIGVAALIMMGTLIGSRFSATSPKLVLSYLLPGLTVTLVAVVLSFLGVLVVAVLLGTPAGLLIVAFSPGGVEAMTAIAMSLGYDPTFVAAHHVFRLLVLSVVMPLVCHRLIVSEPGK